MLLPFTHRDSRALFHPGERLPDVHPFKVRPYF